MQGNAAPPLLSENQRPVERPLRRKDQALRLHLAAWEGPAILLQFLDDQRAEDHVIEEGNRVRRS